MPLSPNSKTPASAHGVKDATSDADQIAKWWGAQPDANVGLACGPPSGFVVLDVDPRNRGDQTLLALTAERGSLPETLTADTGGGGTHYLFVYPEGEPTLRKTLGEGVDVQGGGKYIVAPPSIHPSGREYSWRTPTNFKKLAVLPQWALDLIVKPPASPAPAGDLSTPVDASSFPSWADILIPHGWTFVSTDDGVEYWRRPGKDEGVSASTNYGGSDLFYVFTNSTDFDADQAYDKIGVLAVLKYHGNRAAALSALRLGVKRVAAKPETYSFTSAFPPEHFVSRYVVWASAHTDAPLEYHEAMALGLLAHMSPATRAKLSPYPRGLPLNLYLILCGGTTRTRKSTAQNLGASLLEVPYRPLPGWRMPTRPTPEAMVEDMAKHDGTATLWTPDEFGVTLAQIYRRDFLRGLEELLLTFFGGETYTLRTLQRETTVAHPHLTVIGAATPESLSLAGPGMLLGGLLPRFGVVFPRALPPHRSAGAAPDLEAVYLALSEELRGIFMHTGAKIQFLPAALTLLNEAEEELSKQPYSLRLPIALYKVAALSCIGRLDTTVSVDDAKSAITVVNRWADGAAHLAGYLTKKTQDFEFERIIDSAVDYITRKGGRCARTELADHIKVKERTVREIAETLHGRGRLVIVTEAGVEWWQLL